MTDEGPGIDPKQAAERPRPAPTEVHGRGLWLARQLCDLVSVAAGPRGTTIRLVTSLSRPT